MHLGKGFCACDFMQGKKSFQHFVRKETLQSGLSYCLHENKKSADTFGDPQYYCGLNKGYVLLRASCI